MTTSSELVGIPSKRSAGTEKSCATSSKRRHVNTKEFYVPEEGPPNSGLLRPFSPLRNAKRLNNNDIDHNWKSSRSKFYDGMGIGDSTFESTDEEFLAKYMNNISSASSSISWAEDAVEAGITKKIFVLWEDIQRVCSSEILEKPDDMTIQVYEECLSWKRAFPFQDLAKYSRFTDDNLTPTPTPSKDANVLSLEGSPYTSFSPESPNPACLTPNPEKNALYVAMWLSDCQNHVLENKEVDIADDMGSLSLSSTRNSTPPSTIVIPHPQQPSTAMENLSAIRSLEALDPDPNNFFTSLALNNVISSVDRLNGAGESYTSGGSRGIRVQRPISSNVNGHLITPLRTNYSRPSISRNIHETTGINSNSFRFKNNYNSLSPNRSNVALPKGRTAPVFPVCPPPNVASKEFSAGPRTYRRSMNPPDSIFVTNPSELSTLPFGRTFYDHKESRNELSPARTPISGTYQPSSSFSHSSRGIESDHVRVEKASTWSRHSSSSIEVNRFSGTYRTEDPSKKGEGTDPRYFETISENYSTQSSVKISRPDYLPVSKEVELNPSRSKPVRPFLYWLLDKVSPS